MGNIRKEVSIFLPGLGLIKYYNFPIFECIDCTYILYYNFQLLHVSICTDISMRHFNAGGITKLIK